VTVCADLSERMVVVARRRAEWTPAEHAHLAICSDCAAEWRLVRAGAALGRDLDLAADRIAGRVRGRLAEAALEGSGVTRLVPRSEWRRWAIGLAAAAVLVVATGLGLRGRGGSTEAASSELFAELEDLTPGELELVIKDYPASLDAAMPLGAAGLSDLSAAELERLLSLWEG